MEAHVLIFPLPMQGPVNSMLKLAELILVSSNSQIHVTFLTTDHVRAGLELHAHGSARFENSPKFLIRAFSDGLPPDHPRGSDKFTEMVDAVESASRGIVGEMLTATHRNKRAITCVIADGLFSYVLDMGKEAGVPVVYFDTISPSCLWVYLCLPLLVQHGVVPFQEDEDMDAPVSVPGVGSLLRRRDLPDFCRANNPSRDIMIQRIKDQTKQFNKASGIILNTFEDLEAPLLSYIYSHYPNNVYVVGPLHLHLKERLQHDTALSRTSSNSYYLNSLLWEDKSCVDWLDRQRPRSVIFCSFGSQVLLTKDQLMEFWHGLVNSGVPFLWVKRPKSVVGMDDDDEKWHQQVPRSLLDGVKENGFVTSWVPQEEILSHPSVGGFLTHNGWNSTIESIVAGVPMICWPYYVDQLVTSRFVNQMWEVGVDIKDTCDRVIIEDAVRDLMVRRKDELLQKADGLAKLARQAVDKGGSSYCSLDRLIDDIKSFKLHA